jgi:hypothetical protein
MLWKEIRQEPKIDFDLSEMGCVDIREIELTQDFVQWWLFVVMIV